MNLDDLIPPDKILRAETKAETDRLINERNDDFLKRHERSLSRYLASGRVVSALVSTSVIADVLEWPVRMNNVRQWTVWTIPGLPAEKEVHLMRFAELILR